MKQPALANKPDIVMPIFDDVSDPANKLTLVVVQVMSKYSGGWIKLIEAACFGAKPQIAAVVACNTVDRIAANTVGVAGVVSVAGKTFTSRIEFVHPASVGGNPQVALIVLGQIHNKVGAEAARVVGVVLVYDEGVTVVAIKTVLGGKPHEALAVLQDSFNIALR